MFVAAAKKRPETIWYPKRRRILRYVKSVSYNLQLRNIKAYIPEYPVGTATECADMIHDFLPIARTVIGSV